MPAASSRRLPAPAATDPTPVYRLRDGLYAADLVTAGLAWLDVFSHLDRQPSTLETLCGALQLHVRPADVMITLFAAMGLVARDGDAIGLTPLARDHFVRDSPYSLAAYYASFRERPVCRDLVEVLRTGKPAGFASAKPTDWLTAMLDPGFAAGFTAAMDSRGLYLGPAAAAALDLSGRRTLLDIAGGSGIYACAFVDRHPHLSATVIERPPVDDVARRAIAARGFSDQVGVTPGDMLREPLPAGHDVHLISNVLHDWDLPAVDRILAASFAALSPGGLLVIHDAHLNAEKTGPLPVAAYSVMLMHGTEGRCYSVTEMFERSAAAGFRDPAFVETAGDRSLVTARKPA
ncbi:MAG: methyltransferase [Vicinamibacteraceae bacterium]